jgi:hypothetical protein
MQPPNRRLGWRAHALVLALYTGLTLLLTWPLAANLATHAPGVPQWAYDEATFVWNIWAFKDALIDNLANPLHSELIWYPLGIDLILYTYNFFHVAAALPWALAVNLPFGSNLALLASTVLSGYGTWLLVRSEIARGEGRGARGEPFTIHNSQFTIHNSGARGEGRGATLTLSPSHPLTRDLAAFLAGALYAFASNRAVYAALGHYDMVTTQWIPFYALTLRQALDRDLNPAARRRAALLAGLFFAFTGYAEMISALFLAIFTLIVLLVDGLRGGWRPALRDAGYLSVAGLVALVAWAPALFFIVREFFTASYDLQGWGDALMLSTDLLGWFTPTPLHPLLGGDLLAEMRAVQLRAANPNLAGFRDVNTVFLGWTSLALAVIGALAYRRKVAVWIWTSVLFGVFTLGPLLQINGQYLFDFDGLESTFPLPFLLLHYIPVIKANRAPNRNSVLLMLGLAVLAGYGAYWLIERIRTFAASRTRSPAHPLTPSPTHPLTRSPALWITALLTGLILFEHLAAPLPLTDMRVPALYNEIAADPRPVSVLQAPLGWRNSFGVLGPESTLLQYFQTAHGKPMLGGNISRAPEFKMDYFRRIPFFYALTEIEFGRPVAPEVLAAAQAQAADLMLLYDTGYVVLTPPVPGRFPYADTWQATWDFLKTTLPLEETPFWAQDGYEAYRVIQPAGDDSFRLDLGAPATYAYRGEGWDAPEEDTVYDASAIWATETASRLFLPLRTIDPAATYTVTAQVHPFAYPGAPAQTVALAVNGELLETHTLADGWQTVTWDAPGAVLQDGLNRLELRWDWTAAPRDVLGGDRQIGTTGVQLPLDADLKAFADGGFIALFDDATGAQSDGSAGRRGVNVTVLDPRTGAVRAKEGFDTTASAAESERLAAFLAGVDAGAPVLVVSYGDAWRELSDAAVEQLRTLGADVTLESLQEQYFAIVGVKGAAPGAAAQTVDAADAFLRMSLNRDRRPLAAAVDWVSIAPK